MAWEFLQNNPTGKGVLSIIEGIKAPLATIERIRNEAPTAARELMKGHPEMAPDLTEHYWGSQQLAKEWGRYPAAAAGVFHEAMNVFGSPGGFSLDDLGANWAGYNRLSPEQFRQSGLAQHTEGSDYRGLGQGTIKDTLSKRSKAQGLISQGDNDEQSGSTFRQGDQRQDNQRAPTRTTQTKVDPLRSSRKAAGIAQREAKKEFGAGSKEHLKAIEVTQEAGRKLKGRK